MRNQTQVIGLFIASIFTTRMVISHEARAYDASNTQCVLDKIAPNESLTPEQCYLLQCIFSHQNDLPEQIYIPGSAHEKKSEEKSFTVLNLNQAEKFLSMDADVISIQGLDDADALYETFNALKEGYAHFYVINAQTLIASKYRISDLRSTHVHKGMFCDFILNSEQSPLGHIYISSQPYEQLQTILEKMAYDYQDEIPFLLCSAATDLLQTGSQEEELIDTYFYQTGEGFPLLLKPPTSFNVLGPNYHLETLAIEDQQVLLTKVLENPVTYLGFSLESASLKINGGKSESSTILCADNDRDAPDWGNGDRSDREGGVDESDKGSGGGKSDRGRGGEIRYGIGGTTDHKGGNALHGRGSYGNDNYSVGIEVEHKTDRNGNKSSSIELSGSIPIGGRN